MIELGETLGGRWYTLDEACEAAQVSRRTLNRWISDGRLRVYAGHVNAGQLVEVERERWRTRRRAGPKLRYLTHVS